MYTAPAPYGVDFALISVYVFWGFLLALIFYLRREDRREGYPLQDDITGRLSTPGGFLLTADPKTFILPSGRGTQTVPNARRDTRPLAARLTAVSPGSPIEPTGDPMLAGIGPGSYADRAKVPDLTSHGEPRIVPLSVAKDFAVAATTEDPRGYAVVGTDGGVAGTVKDVWVDRGEVTVRYLEVALAEGGASVLLPITMAIVDKGGKCVKVDAITGAQFAHVPKLGRPDQITLDEEERVTAYYGGGFLYALPSRGEPLL